MSQVVVTKEGFWMEGESWGWEINKKTKGKTKVRLRGLKMGMLNSF